jgi:hypothetical protein
MIGMIKLLLLFLLLSDHRTDQVVQDKNYYVVIGVHTVLEDAIHQTDEANRKGFNAQYAIGPDQQYYVYLLETPDMKRACDFRKKMRKETPYKKAWIYTGKLGSH